MTKEKDPQAMGKLLQDYGDSGLRKIVRQAQRLSLADKLLKECLPENLRLYCRVAKLSATELNIQVDGAAWLTHLRYLKPQLLKQLRQYPQFAYLTGLEFNIQPAQKLEKTLPLKTLRILSQESKELLIHTAEAVNNPLLKKALLKLSQ